MSGFSPTLHPKKTFSQKLLGELLGKSWWVLAFILLNIAIFHPLFKHLDQGEKALRSSLSSLREEKALALKKKSQLELEIGSQDDPFWIEMLLKKELGLVSEGQMKVHFITQ